MTKLSMNPLESQWSCFMWIQRDALPGQESTQGRKIVQSGTSAKSLWRGGKRALNIWTVRHGVSETGSHRSIPFPPTWSFLLQFCAAIVTSGKISPIPNESLLAYLQSSNPYGCFIYYVFQACNLVWVWYGAAVFIPSLHFHSCYYKDVPSTEIFRTKRDGLKQEFPLFCGLKGRQGRWEIIAIISCSSQNFGGAPMAFRPRISFHTDHSSLASKSLKSLWTPKRNSISLKKKKKTLKFTVVSIHWP